MYNILVCDDEREIVDAIEIYLMQEGYQVFKAYDGEEAVNLLKKQEIHLLKIHLEQQHLVAWVQILKYLQVMMTYHSKL